MISYQKGLEAEEAAKQFLLEQGLRWIQSRYRTRFGEIDLIMRDREMLVFVEVRLRKSKAYGLAYESVTWRKQQKLRLTALQYLAHTKAYNRQPARFDVVSFQGSPAKIDWIKNAFEVA